MESQTENALVQWMESINLFEITIIVGVLWIVLKSIFKAIPVMSRAIEGLSELHSLDKIKEDIEDITDAIFDIDDRGKKHSKIERIENAQVSHDEHNKAILSKVNIMENELKINNMKKDENGSS